MNKLLPCPMCGGDPLYGYNGDVNWIECLVCGLSTAFYGKAFAVEYVEEKWNTRHTPEGMALVPSEITAESGHKAGMMGDFSEPTSEDCPGCDYMGIRPDGEWCEECGGKGAFPSQHTISWTTIKAIHRRIVEIAAAPKWGGE